LIKFAGLFPNGPRLSPAAEPVSVPNINVP
jgi:hypothetical protein